MITAEAILERFNNAVDEAIEQQLADIHPFMANMSRYFFGWVDQSFNPIAGRKGKKLRPTLHLLVYEALTGAYQPALPMAAVLELLHNYSLIHDDIEDRDSERRGRPTVWKIWGDGLALNCGSALHALAFQTVLDLADAPAAKIVELYGILASTSIKLCEGQHMDMSFEKAVDVTENMYLAMIERKTAALLEYSTTSAALLATTDQDLITAYQNFGRNLGLAFQIRDDYLNLWVDGKSVGKPQYSDLRKKKKTLPVIHTLNALPGGEQMKLLDIYNRQTEAMSEREIDYTVACLAQVNAQKHTATAVNRYTAEALLWLDQCNLDNQAQTQLRVLTSFLTGREF